MAGLVYDATAPKKSTNLTVNSDLMRRAKERGINVSSVLEKALAEELRLLAEAEWKEENQESVEHFNRTIQKIGLFSDGSGTF